MITIDTKQCKTCNLCKTQEPLLDRHKRADVMWVGISAKQVEDIKTTRPLSEESNSGKILGKIESNSEELQYYRTNLVKCPPLTDSGKLRYPNLNEQEACYSNLIGEIDTVKPKVVFMLGLKVSNFLLSKNDIKVDGFESGFNYTGYNVSGIHYVPVHHPSYVYVYKRKKMNAYVNAIKSVIKSNQVLS